MKARIITIVIATIVLLTVMFAQSEQPKLVEVRTTGGGIQTGDAVTINYEVGGHATIWNGNRGVFVENSAIKEITIGKK